MRVLLLSLHFAPDTVSNAVVVTDLAETLAEQGHEVTVVSALPYHQEHRIEEGYRGRLWRTDWHGRIRVIRTWLLLRGTKQDVKGRFLAYGTFNVTSTLAALLAGPCDVVITPSPPLTIGLCGWLVARVRGARFIYNVQDIYPDAAIKLGLLRKPWLIRLFTWMERTVYRKADAVAVLSEGFKRNLLGKGVPHKKVAVIPNGLDIEFIRPTEGERVFRRELGLDGQLLVLYAGNVGLAQGLDTLTGAAERVRCTDVRFAVVGAGAEIERVRRDVAERKIDNVRCLPFQARERVPDLYASADVGVVMLRPGMGDTSVPSKVYSIMAAGKAVVASVDPGSDVWRLVEEVGCGVCVRPGDPTALAETLDELSHDRSLTAWLGSRGRAYIECYHSRQAVGTQYDALMRRLAPQIAS